VNTLQETLGQALLVLVGLVVILFAVIVLLVEADYIVRLGGKLTRRWRDWISRGSGSPATKNRMSEREYDERGV
jgi:hypothetical protein